MSTPESERSVHPVAALFPLLPDEELAELAADIAERGLLQPVILDADGRVLDGRNRLAACALAGVEPAFTVYEGDDPDGYALTVNIARRHLSAGARAIIAAQAARMSGQSTREAESGANLLHGRINEANQVLDWAPDLVPNVVAGAHPLYKAVETARQRKRDAEALAAKMAILADSAPDLRALVEDESLGVDDAIAALKAREEKARREEEERLEEEARAEHERSVIRAREVEAARAASTSIVGRVQSEVASILAGAQHGERGLVTRKAIDELKHAISLLEEAL